MSEIGGGDSVSAKRVLIYGAGDAGQMIVREMRQNPSLGNRPVGFVDDDSAKIGRRIHGVRVLGGHRDIPDIIDRVAPTEILLALPTVDPADIRRIVRSLENYKLPIKTLPTMREIIDGRVGVAQIRTLRLEDLLARPPVGLDSRAVRRLIHGRRVLVTGAGGSIGSELCRQIMSFRPASLVLFERYENSLHALRLELEDAGWGGVVVTPAIGDVTDAALVSAVFAQHRPELVFHAAAHKHVTLMEENPCEAVKNNVRGTRIVAAAAEAAGVDRVILISTDKAANPISVMGASKRLAELAVHAQADGSATLFAVVRFGNVLGSNGSVVPRFIEQIRAGGPVTVTHPDVRRFFMLIPEAVQLVLHAAADAHPGQTYVLDMGEQIKLVDVARNLISLSGHVPDEEIRIEFIGLRPGEKMEEELSGVGEELRASPIPKVFVVHDRGVPTPDFMASVAALEELALRGDTVRVLSALRAMTGMGDARVPEGAAVSATATAPSPLKGVPSSQPGLHPCPKCGSEARRSRGHRLDQQIRKRFSALRPYRCLKCDWRGWLLPRDPTALPGTLGGETRTPDFSALDHFASTEPPPVRSTFSPKDL